MIRLRTFYEQLNVQLAVAGLIIFLSFVVNMAEAQWMGPASSASYGLEPEAKAGLRRTPRGARSSPSSSSSPARSRSSSRSACSAHEFWCSEWNLFGFFIVFSSLFDCLGPCRPRNDLAPCCDVACPASASNTCRRPKERTFLSDYF